MKKLFKDARRFTATGWYCGHNGERFRGHRFVAMSPAFRRGEAEFHRLIMARLESGLFR